MSSSNIYTHKRSLSSASLSSYTTSSHTNSNNHPTSSIDQLDGLDASVWSTIAAHGHAIDIYSPDIQEIIDVTDERLRNLYDAFDRDFDGRLSKPELLQGLAQQGFHNLQGTR